MLVGVAERLQAEGRDDLARELLRLVQQRYPASPAAQRAAQLLAVRARRDDSGRTELIVGGTVYGAALGIAVPLAFEADDPEAFGAGLLLGAPAGFWAARMYARSRPLSQGQASAIISGTAWGAWQAYGWSEVFDWGESQSCPPPEIEGECFEEGAETHEIMRTMIAGSLVGMGVGTLLSRKPITRGTASTVNLGALWGTWFGVAAGIAAGLEDDDLLAATLAGGNLGLLGGALGNPRWRLTEQRARLISVAGLGGGLAGLGTLLIFRSDNINDESMLVPLGGSVLGLALGTYWTRNMEREAAIDVGSRRLGLQLPMVQPALVESGRGQYKPGVKLNLLQAQF